jgi:hypothetical protein
MDIYSEYKFFTFDTENSILYHEVTDENFGDKELFVNSMASFTTLIEKIQPKRIIIKVLKKPSYFELGMKNFMQSTLYSTLLKTGIRKVAFFVSDNNFIDELYAYESDDSIKVKFFAELEKAKQWVLV